MAETRIPIKHATYILESDLEEKFVHSGGPGGQNVNKLATGVQLRYNPRRAATLPWPVIAKVEQVAGKRLNAEGDIVISATRFRSQEKNRDDARKRLVALIEEAAAPPPPKRRPTRPTLGSKKRRLESKAKRGTVKKLRGKVDPD
ncbi:alternative ribosome rescue aminoacyl-tRNA hydrolase ArfB [Pseudahrensia aquimaris]|uniref:Alternative ribosome rescue aminoacyl-tRNA hydrolase ArfB n=1 Tax=Pseudahrensia aquimaris TaxID=744461 RepID=A0ABW3FED6_9HYPH